MNIIKTNSKQNHVKILNFGTFYMKNLLIELEEIQKQMRIL
jgi:hypothetical protein